MAFIALFIAFFGASAAFAAFIAFITARGYNTPLLELDWLPIARSKWRCNEGSGERYEPNAGNTVERFLH